jgi:hypothetical protein
MKQLILAAAFIVGASATSATALPPLSQQDAINEGLLAVGIADEIRKKCDAIAPRMIRALTFMNSLENKAKAMGYSEADIKAYVTDKAEKAKMRAKGEAYLTKAGVMKNNPLSYCTVGRDEVARGSLIGSFLRVR